MDEPRALDPRQVASKYDVHVSGGVVGAIGDHATVVMSRRAVSWPAVVGSPPSPATGFQVRAAIVDQMTRADAAVVLRQPSGQVMSGGGGVGKTQIAAGVFDSSRASLRVWVTADSRTAVVTGFAQAAVQLDLADQGEDPEQLAGLFLGYLRGTEQAWLVVLDDLRDPRDLAGLWPPGGGRLIVTTRRRDAALSGGGRRVIEVGVFTQAEARDYLVERLTPMLGRLPDGVLAESGRLSEDLGYLPLALAQAAAVLIDQGISCAAYQAQFADRARTVQELFPSDADADGYAMTVATTWKLAVEAADRLDPVGLARPMASLVSMLDPAGVPESVLTSQPVCALLSEVTQAPVTATTARQALRALDRLSLIDHDPRPGNPRGVRMHNLTGRAIRQTLAPVQTAAFGRSAADGLLQAWPQVEKDAVLAESLRSNTAALTGCSPAGLWDTAGTGAHAVLFRSGRSLTEAGLVGPAITYHLQLRAEACALLTVSPNADDRSGRHQFGCR